MKRDGQIAPVNFFLPGGSSLTCVITEYIFNKGDDLEEKGLMPSCNLHVNT